MSQTKRQSIVEVLVNTFSGLIGSFLITMACLQLFTTHVSIAASTTVLCTVWSILRGYTLRRMFNKINSKERTQ